MTEELKRYYYDEFYDEFTPQFDDLTQKQKRSIESSYGFLSWKLNREFSRLKADILKALGLK